MKRLLLCLAMLAAACTPAAPPLTPEEAAAGAATTYPHALRMAQAMLPADDGIPSTVRVVSLKLPDQIKADMLGSAAQYNLTPEETAKLQAYVETLPKVVNEVIVDVMPDVHARLATEFSKRFRPEEAAGIAEFYESPAGKAQNEVTSAVSEEDRADGKIEPLKAMVKSVVDLPKEHFDKVVEFSRSPAGKAFKREGDMLDGIVARVVSEALREPLVLRLSKDACQQVSLSYCAIRQQ